MFVRFLFVFDLLFNLVRIALWPSVWEGADALAFQLCCFYFSPFPVWCLERGVEFDCIGPWSLPLYLLFSVHRVMKPVVVAEILHEELSFIDI